MKLNAAHFVAAVALVAYVTVLARANDDAGQEVKVQVRTRFQLPSLFNFERFKKMFNKHYSSFVEEMVRQKIVLGRAFRAFISMVKYKRRQVSYYLSVNMRSDLTPKERARSWVDPEAMRVPFDPNANFIQMEKSAARPIPEAEPTTKAQSSLGGADEIPVADLKDIERQLLEIESRKNEPGYKELAEELEKMRDSQKLSRRRRRDLRSDATTSDKHQSLSPDDLMRPNEEQLSAETRSKMQYRVPGNNPDYEPPELNSSAGGDEREGNWVKPLGEGLVGLLSKLPGAQYVRGVVTSSLDSPSADIVDVGETSKPDEVFLDLRRNNCFYLARQQGECGSCYSFAAIAYYEYLYCMETGNIVAFSEQYMLDCGAREELKGCISGRLDKSMDFVEKYGLELRLDYPYREQNETCPYESNVHPRHMGRLKTMDSGTGWLQLHQFDGFMQQTGRPIVFGISVSPDFDDYGGGVDMGENCKEGGGHAMLIVGYGREDGEEYYLFRNSYSVSWGEQGYYKFARSQLTRCALDPYGFVGTGHFKKPTKQLVNQNYYAVPVSSRYINYLNQIPKLSASSQI